MQIHGIRPCDTEHAPDFPEVWAEVAEYLQDCTVLVAHNTGFDMGCIRHSLERYGMEKPDVTCYCSLRAARHIYSFSCNRLDYLCDQFEISSGTHHRAGNDAEMCARLFLREMKDAGQCVLEGMSFCNVKL
jgi:DNA polymerase-3 subunit epsilon